MGEGAYGREGMLGCCGDQGFTREGKNGRELFKCKGNFVIIDHWVARIRCDV